MQDTNPLGRMLGCHGAMPGAMPDIKQVDIPLVSLFLYFLDIFFPFYKLRKAKL
jgi:hypothetical protein